MSQAYVKSIIQNVLNFLVLKIRIVYLPRFRKVLTPWDHGSLPIQFMAKN